MSRYATIPKIGSRPKSQSKANHGSSAQAAGVNRPAVTVIGVIIVLAILAIAAVRYYKNRETDVASSNLEEAADKADAYLRVVARLSQFIRL